MQHCDQTSWGVHLLELTDRGLNLGNTIADAGQALQAGQKAAWGKLSCHTDVFHAEKGLNELAWFLARRARGCTLAHEKIEQKYQQIERSCKRQTLGRKLSLARRQEQKTLALAADVRVLANWMGQDVLALAVGGVDSPPLAGNARPHEIPSQLTGDPRSSAYLTNEPSH